jgi:hypothetical protein
MGLASSYDTSFQAVLSAVPSRQARLQNSPAADHKACLTWWVREGRLRGPLPVEWVREGRVPALRVETRGPLPIWWVREWRVGYPLLGVPVALQIATGHQQRVMGLLP